MSCNRCSCQSFKESASKWSKERCSTCNHPVKDHKLQYKSNNTRSSAKSVIIQSVNKNPSNVLYANKYANNMKPSSFNASRNRSYTTRRTTTKNITKNKQKINGVNVMWAKQILANNKKNTNNMNDIDEKKKDIHKSTCIDDNYFIGNKLSVSYQNQWYNAKIIDMDNNQIRIQYDEYDEDYDEWINKHSKRLRFTSNNTALLKNCYILQSSTSIIPEKSISVIKDKLVNHSIFKPTSSTIASVSVNHSPKNKKQLQKNANFKINNKLKVLYESEWYDARIIDSRNDQIRIEYDEYDDEYNEWIDKTSTRLKFTSVFALKDRFNHSTHNNQSPIKTKNKRLIATISVSAMKKRLNNSKHNNHVSKSKTVYIPQSSTTNAFVSATKTNSICVYKSKRLKISTSSVADRIQQFKKSRDVFNNFKKKPFIIPELHNKTLSTGDCCFCDVSKLNIITLSKCNDKICKDCLKVSIEQSSNKLKTECPICKAILQQSDIRLVLGSQQFFDIILSPNLRKCDECNKLWCLHSMSKENQKWFCKISQCQQDAINYVNDLSIKKSEDTSQKQRLIELIQSIDNGKYAITIDDTLQSLYTFLESIVPITIRLPAALISTLIYDTHYRNCFEVGAKGSSYHVTRKTEETKMFGPIYDGMDVTAFDKPKYGCLNIGLLKEGCLQAIGYGDSYFLMNDNTVRWRTTMTIIDSFGVNGNCGTLKHCNHLLTQLSSMELQDIIEAAVYKKQGGIHQKTYREIQIHGPVQLNRDIKSLHVPKTHQSNISLVNILNDFCQKNKCQLVWF